jgi:hypothetical protein
MEILREKSEACFVAMDEFTDMVDTRHHAIFIRGVDSKFKVTEELASLWHKQISIAGGTLLL